MKAYFISGTGTGVGKTVATALLAKSLIAEGRSVAVMKPVQTGLSEEGSDDLGRIRSLVPEIMELPLSLASPYRFSMPVSPHLASKAEGARIKTEKILSALHKIESAYSPDILLVEGAGGLLVPLNGKETNADLIKLMGFPVILVANASLGTLNHIFLSIEALAARNISCAGIVVSIFPEKAGVIEKDNIKTIRKRSGLPILSVIPYLDKKALFELFSQKNTKIYGKNLVFL